MAVVSIALYCLRPRELRSFHLVVLGLWLVVPPIWFVIETMWLVKDRQNVELKQSQELISKVWAGVSALLAMLAATLK